MVLPLGYILVGPIADAIGPEATLLGAAAWTVFSSLAILIIPSVRNMRRSDSEVHTAPVRLDAEAPLGPA
jgi:hypothetical protein